MAEPLTFLAEEIGRTFALIWGGVGIAVKLNYEIMSAVVIFTTRIVQLLLLLTQKATSYMGLYSLAFESRFGHHTADVFSILGNDIIMFVGDIGSGVVAISNTIESLGSGLVSALETLLKSSSSGFTFIYLSFQSIYAMAIEGIVSTVNLIGSLFDLLKYGFILIGSSVYFALLFLPNLLCLLGVTIIQFTCSAFLKSTLFIQNFKCIFKEAADNFSLTLCTFLYDIPVKAFLGVVLFIIIIFGIKYAMKYIFHNFMITEFNFMSSVSRFRCKLIHWYTSVRFHSDQTQRINTSETFTVRTNDPNRFDAQPNSSRNVDNVQLFTFSTYARRPIKRKHSDHIFKECNNEEIVIHKTNLNNFEENLSSKSTKSCNLTENIFKILKEEREEKLCIVCQDKLKCIILLPCRHLCLCEPCRSVIITRDNNCPICRKPILDSLRVYL